MRAPCRTPITTTARSAKHQRRPTRIEALEGLGLIYPPPPPRAPGVAWRVASAPPLVEEPVPELDARFSRAMVLNTKGGSLVVAGWGVPGAGGGAAGSSQRVMRTASGIPERLGRSRSELSAFARRSVSPQESYQSKPS